MTKGLTRSGIDWVQFGWPCITGCDRKCSIDGEIYCYAYNMVTKGRLKGHRWYNPDFSPKFNKDVLEAPLGRQKPATIFIAPLGEMWGSRVLYKWKDQILGVVGEASQHTFLNLTKNPKSVIYYQDKHVPEFPDNLWLGVSVTTKDSCINLQKLYQVRHPHKFVSFEPLLEDVTSSDNFTLEGIKWVIIGALSLGATKIQPDPAHIVRLYSAARQAGIPVFIKDNCTYFNNPPKEFPEGFPE